MKLLFLPTLALALGIIAVACGSDDGTPVPTPTNTPIPMTTEAREIKVEVKSFSIQPESVNLKSGERIKFIASNSSNSSHTFTVASTSEKKEILVDLSLSGGDSKSQEMVVAPNTLTLYYFCRLHEGSMKGTFRVGDPTAGSGSDKETPTPNESPSDYY